MGLGECRYNVLDVECRCQRSDVCDGYLYMLFLPFSSLVHSDKEHRSQLC